MSDNVFYKDGLHFSCIGCHACCRHDPGYVFLTESDIQRMLDYLNIPLKKFLDTYCRIEVIGPFKRVSLIEKANYDCIFWKDGCTIYDARPLQCRSYPFWNSVMQNRASWDNEGSNCPGINKGTLHDRKEIDAWLESNLSDPIIEID
ncbi:YkgJ family cysteine cluster protein [Spirochaeta cellobiosiphila]|uniref:YkgJ family cysteine cluster protein n=1 Tax=Spirochaeta cellobiosiphila TaxID=504483 RepID=UPI000404D9CA|nr:YkgJ family cysteine cluster protein [Spirochaeta cellobiosiphila]